MKKQLKKGSNHPTDARHGTAHGLPTKRTHRLEMKREKILCTQATYIIIIIV